MQVRGNLHAARERGPGQRVAFRPHVPVVAGPRQVEGALAGRRAPGKRSVGPVRAAAREMPAGAREPSGHLRHVCENGFGRGARSDAGIDESLHVVFPR